MHIADTDIFVLAITTVGCEIKLWLALVVEKKIYTRSRKPEESITAYIAALRELALNCEYSSTDLLDIAADTIAAELGDDWCTDLLFKQHAFSPMGYLEVSTGC